GRPFDARVIGVALITDSCRHADALAEIRKLQHHADDARIERPALLRVHRVDDAEHAADVQHLDHIAGLHGLRQVTRIAKQRLAMAERADDDVALGELRHAAAGQLQRLGDGSDLVDEHSFHGCDLGKRDDCVHCCFPALAQNIPGKPTILEKPSASAAVHSPAASPYTPFDTVISEKGETTPATKALPGRYCTVTSPVTRACEALNNASMSRQTGSRCWPSWTRSP